MTKRNPAKIENNPTTLKGTHAQYLSTYGKCKMWVSGQKNPKFGRFSLEIGDAPEDKAAYYAAVAGHAYFEISRNLSNARREAYYTDTQVPAHVFSSAKVALACADAMFETVGRASLMISTSRALEICDTWAFILDDVEWERQAVYKALAEEPA
jgi:hypothetical protein